MDFLCKYYSTHKGIKITIMNLLYGVLALKTLVSRVCDDKFERNVVTCYYCRFIRSFDQNVKY